MTDPVEPTKAARARSSRRDEGRARAARSGPGAGQTDQALALELDPEERKRVDEIKQAVDVTDSQMVIQYGLPAQNKLSTFADSLLSRRPHARTPATPARRSPTCSCKVRELDVDGLASRLAGLAHPSGGHASSTPSSASSARYQKLSSNIERLHRPALERTRMGLLKDLTVLDKMYELNLEYLRQLDLYIAAGDEILEELQTKQLPAMEVEARASQDPLVAQQLTDFRQAVLRFERRLHDLKLTRMIAIQTAPQIRLIQRQRPEPGGEDPDARSPTPSPCGRTRSSSPSASTGSSRPWPCRRRSPTPPTSCSRRTPSCSGRGRPRWPARSSAASSTSRRCKKVNDDLIATLEETIRIQEEGHTKRLAAEGELTRMQGELKQRLIDLQARR